MCVLSRIYIRFVLQRIFWIFRNKDEKISLAEVTARIKNTKALKVRGVLEEFGVGRTFF